MSTVRPGRDGARAALTVIFLASAIPKLVGARPMRALWAFYRLPRWFMVVTGVVELLTGLAATRRETARLSGALAMAVMVGAMITNGRDRRSALLILVNLGITGIGWRVLGNAAHDLAVDRASVS